MTNPEQIADAERNLVQARMEAQTLLKELAIKNYHARLDAHNIVKHAERELVRARATS